MTDTNATAHPAAGPRAQLRDRPTAEEIARLPLFEGLSSGQIVVLRTPTDVEDALRCIEREGVVGFDTESKPTFAAGAEQTGPHVIQFAVSDRAFIVQVDLAPHLNFLKRVIESETVVKIGFGLKSDGGPLEKKLGIRLRASVDLSTALRSLKYKNALGAKVAVAIVLGQQLQKSKKQTTSNWALPTLSPAQLRYAANDAYAALCVFKKLGSPYRPQDVARPKQRASAGGDT